MEKSEGIFLGIFERALGLFREILLEIVGSLRKSSFIQPFFGLKKEGWMRFLLIFLGSFFATLAFFQLIKNELFYFILNGVIALLLFGLIRYSAIISNLIVSSRYSTVKKVSRWSNALKI